MAEPLVDPQLLRRLEQFQMRAGRRSRSSARGERRSRARGQSVEFADFRNYVPGDDLRYLDWNLYGRLDRLFLKLYEEERELPVRIFLDASESMSFGLPSKFHFARQAAAAIAYVALCGFDRVSVLPFPEPPDSDLTRRAMRSIRGRASSLALFHHLAELKPGGAGSLNDALRRGALESKQTGAAIVLSDFLDVAGYEAGLSAIVARGFQVHALQILSPEEVTPATYGELRWVDCETGAIQEVSFGKFRLKAYQQTVQNYVQRLREFCQSRGASFLSVTTDTPLEVYLLQHLRRASLWG